MTNKIAKMKKEDACEYFVLKTRSQYLGILDLIRKDTARIIIVQIDGEDKKDPVVKKAVETMTLEKKESVSEWPGTVKLGGAPAVQYTFLKTGDFFDYLSRLESFFLVTSENPYRVKKTGFGYDDVAFLDGDGELLFFTITHEGDAFLNKRYPGDRLLPDNCQ